MVHSHIHDTYMVYPDLENKLYSPAFATTILLTLNTVGHMFVYNDGFSMAMTRFIFYFTARSTLLGVPYILEPQACVTSSFLVRNGKHSVTITYTSESIFRTCFTVSIPIGEAP